MRPTATSEFAVYALIIGGLVALMTVTSLVTSHYPLSGFEVSIAGMSVCFGLRAYANQWWPVTSSQLQLIQRMTSRSALIFLGIQCVKFFWPTSGM